MQALEHDSSIWYCLPCRRRLVTVHRLALLPAYDLQRNPLMIRLVAVSFTSFYSIYPSISCKVELCVFGEDVRCAGDWVTRKMLDVPHTRRIAISARIGAQYSQYQGQYSPWYS